MAGAQVRVDAIMHATEDPAKITGALGSVLGIEPNQLETRSTGGHYRNPIVTASAVMRGEGASAFMRRFGAALSEGQSRELLDTIHARTRGPVVHIRISKQEMVSGRIVLQDSDAVRIRVSVQARGRPRGDALAEMLGRH